MFEKESKEMIEVKQDIPPCIYCKHCKLEFMNSVSTLYYCGNSYAVDVVTGAKVYRYCGTSRYGESCAFEPTLFYKIKKLLFKE